MNRWFRFVRACLISFCRWIGGQFFANLGGNDAAYLEGTLGIDDDEGRKTGRLDNGEKILNRLFEWGCWHVDRCWRFFS